MKRIKDEIQKCILLCQIVINGCIFQKNKQLMNEGRWFDPALRNSSYKIRQKEICHVLLSEPHARDKLNTTGGKWCFYGPSWFLTCMIISNNYRGW